MNREKKAASLDKHDVLVKNLDTRHLAPVVLKNRARGEVHANQRDQRRKKGHKDRAEAHERVRCREKEEATENDKNRYAEGRHRKAATAYC
ncbi:hypothetical protein [Paraburkholderia sp. BL21I4N1]|uniref:hypothetical protein n=1 Tax=Paraburkholderia sp. BL21I4N1 TaxID=1938801 RepID=UPI0011B24A01|nr:hypothetical protein [Paraburkholderia sp. BL21I4N1]